MVERMPEFPGGNNKIGSYISQNIVYPQAAIDSNIQGKVITRFIVDSSGKVTDPEIVKSVHPLLDSAAIDVIEKMPEWKPGEDNGRKVHVFFTLPITFHIEDDTKKKKQIQKTSSKSPVSKGHNPIIKK